VTLLSLPLRYRRLLIDAFADLAGMSPPPAAVSESVFQLESASGVSSYRLSFVRGLSGPEAIVKTLPDLKSAITLEAVGLNPDQIEITRKVIAKGGGLYLLSSPGREGIATTLFALLRAVHRPRTRAVTIEEQFRFRSEGLIQLERRDVDRQFAGDWTRLAESLEPGALLIEHVADPSDFSDLIHLAQSGLTVLCGIRRLNFDRTLRTLLSLDVDPFILARVVRVVMHQRLVNLLCQECRRPVPAKPSLRMVGEKYRAQLEEIIEEASFFVPAGCPRCKGTGYSGKMALVELLPFTPAVENLVSTDTWLEEKLTLLLQEDFYSAVFSVHDLLRRGMVTYDDVLPFFR
jgi:type II secretory ATPase GspE/PulE/Tfp pilus assembly ATPase PilB-like protein